PRRENCNARPRSSSRKTSWPAFARPCCRAYRPAADAGARGARCRRRTHRARSARLPAGPRDRRSTGAPSSAESNDEPFDNLTVHDMPIDDLVDVVPVDIGVPDRVRVNDDDRAFLAAVETTGLVDAHLAFAGQSERLHALFCILLHFERTRIRTAFL